MDKRETFADKYGLVPEEYSDVPIEYANFSIRTYNRLKINKINTLEELLQSNSAQILSIKGMGAGSFNEVLTYIKSLRNTDEEKIDYKIVKKMSQPYWAKENRDILFEGKFDELECKYAENDSEYVECIKEAYGLLDRELILEARDEPESALRLMRMLSDFYNGMKRLSDVRGKLKESLRYLMVKKSDKRVIPYIEAYTMNEQKREDLMKMCGKEGGTFKELESIYPTDYDTCITFMQFLAWCGFDLNNELEKHLTGSKGKDRSAGVIRYRASGFTLEETGNVYGVTRERIRQIEAKTIRKFRFWEHSQRFLAKLAAECGCASVVRFDMIRHALPDYADVLIYLCRQSDSDSYYIDMDLEILVIGEPDYSVRIQRYVDMLPEVFNVREILNWSESLPEKIPEDILQKAVEMQYSLTGDTYHRSRLSMGFICEYILSKYYPDGLHVYDKKDLDSFRNHIYQEYGEVKMSDTDRALAARICDSGVLCGRGRYKSKQESYISPDLANEIKNYIEGSDDPVFLFNSLYVRFEEWLIAEGIDNKYFLQGILKEIFGNRYIFRRDYLTKDADVTSVYGTIVSFIKDAQSFVSKAEIMDAFPGLTEIVLNFAVNDSDVLNYFGIYVHGDNIKLYEDDYTYVKGVIDKLLSGNDVLHVKDIYEYMNADNAELLNRTGAVFPFRLFSLLEFMFSEDFQFARPYIALADAVIGRPMERFRELLEQQDVTRVDDLIDLARECHFQIGSLVDFLNGFSETHLMMDKKHLIKISATGIDEAIAKEMETLILNEISGTKVVSQLVCRSRFPTVNVEWDEWLVYSTVLKWCESLEVGMSSRSFKDSVALVAPAEKFDAGSFSDVVSGTNYKADDLDDIDSLIADIIEEEIEV